MSMTKVRQLLPLLEPIKYEVSIEPDLEALTFTGELDLSAKVTKSTNVIRLHANGLKITEATLVQNKKTLSVSKVVLDGPNEEVELHFNIRVSKGLCQIKLSYSGKISLHPHGIYRSSYAEKGTEKYLLASQFESTHARTMLPCIDEPAAKAIFQLSVKTPLKQVVVSNTLAESETINGKSKLTTFKPTPRMSSYLLAVTAGDWKYQQTKTKRGTIIRTYAIPSQIKFAGESLVLAKKALEFYENYFGIHYPLENLNQIAIPDMEPGVGAMENWGCVVYRADSLLVDPSNTSQDMQIYNTIVVAHELAHMWFGNLVTMDWWDDLWLNEGFASWIEYKCSDHIRPKWHMWREFISSDMLSALRSDSYSTTHPIYAKINHPGEIAQKFDAITYRKGSSSIRMLESYLGEETFRKGLRKYLKTYAYKNATRNDLWTVLESVSKKPVKEFMHKWVHQAGHPIISYRRKKNTVQFEQKLFRFNQKANMPSLTWPVPIHLQADAKTHKLEVGTKSSTIKLKASPEAFINLNVGQSGFYRVDYSHEDLLKLDAKLAQNSLSELDAIGLVGDQLDLTIAGYSNTPELLRLFLSARKSNIAEVWEQISSGIGTLNLTFGSDEFEALIRPYVHNLISYHYNKLSWKVTGSDSHNNKKLQLIILSLSARYEYGDAITRVTELYKDLKRGKKLNPDIREIVIGTIARRGGVEEFKQFIEWHKATDSSEEQRRLARGLTNFKQVSLAKKALKFMRSEVRIQDAYVWIIYLCRNRHSKELMWDYVEQNWKWFHDNYSATMVKSSLVESILGSYSDMRFARKAKNFFKTKDTSHYSQGLKNGLDIIEYRSAFKQRDAAKLKHYLENLC